LEDFKKATAAHRFLIVSHGSVEDASFAIGNGQEHGFVSFRLRRVGGAVDGDILGRSTELAVKFVFGVEPFVRKSLGDGMLRAEVFDEEGGAWAMAAAVAFGSVVAHDLTIDGVEPSAILDERPPAPTTDRE